jgi:hypothetical protein
MLWIYRMTSLVSCCTRIVNQNKWPTLLHDGADVTSRSFLLMSFFPDHYACLICFHQWYSPSIFIFPVCWHNRHHSSWPFLECRPSKLYFKILWKYDEWSNRFHHFLENDNDQEKKTLVKRFFFTCMKFIKCILVCFNLIL